MQNNNFEGLTLDKLKMVMLTIYKGSNQEEIIQATQYLK